MYPNRFVTKKTAPMKCIREFLRSPKPLGRVVDQLARARRGPETRSREAKDEVLSEWSSAIRKVSANGGVEVGWAPGRRD